MKCPDPHCDNDGCTHDPQCDGECEHCPVPCEWCYTNPESDMNLKEKQEVNQGERQ